MSNKYVYNNKDRKFKVYIKSIVPTKTHMDYSINHWDLIKLPKRLSIVFTDNFLILKKFNRKIIEIPYSDIINWGNYKDNYWTFSWKLSEYTIIYNNYEKFLKYFKTHSMCIVYLKTRYRISTTVLNNTMNFYKDNLSVI